MRLHTGEKPYHCSHCDRQFVQVANLRRHLRVHTGERPYACELCAAKFSDSNQLKAHLLIHKNEKPFKCEHCLMRFRRRHHLVHHKCPRPNNTTTTILPASLVTTQLGTSSSSRSSHVGSPSVACSEDLGDDIDVDVDMDSMDHHQQHQHQHDDSRYRYHPAASLLRTGHLPIRQLPSPSTLALAAPVAMPLNLSGSPVELPEQTEPEDLSMSSAASRNRDYRIVLSRPSNSHSSGGGSPMSDDIVHEEDEDEEAEELDVARASPSSLFAPEAHRVR